MGPLTSFHDVSVIYFPYEIQMFVNEKNCIFPTSVLPYTDRARSVLDCLIGRDRVDRIGSGYLALA